MIDDVMEESTSTEYNQLAGITISLDFEETRALIEKGVFRDGTHAFATTIDVISNGDYFQYLEKKYGISWHRSNETLLSENPYTNWISKKRWPLNEELNIHMILFQQV